MIFVCLSTYLGLFSSFMLYFYRFSSFSSECFVFCSPTLVYLYLFSSNLVNRLSLFFFFLQISCIRISIDLCSSFFFCTNSIDSHNFAIFSNYSNIVENHVTYNGLFSRFGCKRLNKKVAVVAEEW